MFTEYLYLSYITVKNPLYIFIIIIFILLEEDNDKWSL